MADTPPPSSGLLNWLNAHVEIWIALIGGGALWLGNRLTGKAAMQTAVNEGFQKLLEQINTAHAEERAVWEVEQTRLNQNMKELTTAVQALVTTLRDHGIPLPPLKLPSFMTLEP